MPRPLLPDFRPFRGGTGGRLLLLCYAAMATACTDVELAPPLAEAAPPEEADRQSWDVRVQMRGPSSDLIIIAPYLSDHLASRQTRADSGALVLLIDRLQAADRFAERDTSRIEAASLVVDHTDGSVTFGGDVRVTGPRVTLQTDSLRWERDTDSLAMPRRVEMTVADGQVRAERLAGTTGLAHWRGTSIFGSFQVEGDTTDYRVGIEGRTADVKVRPAGLLARFDTVTSHWRGRRLTCLTAVYDGIAETVDFHGAITIRDSGRTLSADSMHLDLQADRRRAHGHVHLQEADRLIEATTLTDDEAGWRAIGTPVRVQVAPRKLTAPTVSYDAESDRLIAVGGVTIEEGQTRSLRAEDLELALKTDELLATRIELKAEEFEGRLTAGEMRSSDAGDIVALSGAPRLVQDGDGDNQIVITADTLRLDMPNRSLGGQGNFELSVSQNLTLTALAGHFDARADSLRLSGNTLMAYHQDGTSQRLEAGTVSIDLLDGEARSVRWPSKVSGRLEDVQQTTWLQAASGALSLRDSKLDTLKLQGSPDVTHHGHEEDRASRFRADEMILIFAPDGSLSQLVAVGGATALSRIADTDGQIAVNEVKGARLLIELHDGAVVAVRVLDKIEGRYMPPEQDPEIEGRTP